jgi:hypothetical protein
MHGYVLFIEYYLNQEGYNAFNTRLRLGVKIHKKKFSRKQSRRENNIKMDIK